VELWSIPVVVAVGVASGFLNVVAGGGSLLAMPLMIFLGMPPAVANGTTRIALLAQNVTAVGAFKQRGFSDFRLSLTLGLCALPGAVVGALMAVQIDPLWFKRLLAVVMVVVLGLVLRRPKRAGPEDALDDGTREAPTPAPPSRGRLVAAHLAMVATGVYGGFIQAGVGFILMALLHRLLRLDLVRVNMHKVFIVGIYTIATIVVFLGKDRIEWGAGALLALGHVAGGWLGTHVQITGGERVIQVVFALAVVATIVGLLLS
jgi:uncharacterized membrane protein YfcA